MRLHIRDCVQAVVLSAFASLLQHWLRKLGTSFVFRAELSDLHRDSQQTRNL